MEAVGALQRFTEEVQLYATDRPTKISGEMRPEPNYLIGLPLLQLLLESVLDERIARVRRVGSQLGGEASAHCPTHAPVSEKQERGNSMCQWGSFGDRNAR